MKENIPIGSELTAIDIRRVPYFGGHSLDMGP